MRILSFAWKDLTRRAGELSFVILGTAFGIAAVFILFSLRFGIEETLFEAASRKNPLSEITVYAGSGGNFLKLIGNQNQKTLTPATLEEFTKMPQVKHASPHMVYQNLASLDMEILGQTLQTDSLILGMPREVIENELPENESWTEKNFIPVLVSKKLLDFYNLSLAPGAGLPNVSENTFQGQEIRIYPGYSSFFSHTEKPKEFLLGKVVGFSDRVDMIGITIPIEIVHNLNADEGRTEDLYNKVFLSLDSPRNVSAVTEKLESQGYRVTSLQKEFQDVNRSLKYIEIIFFILSSIILAISLLLIGNSFWSQLLKRHQELGILRAIGASQRALSLLFLLEAIFIGFIGALFGIAGGQIAVGIFKKLLTQSFTLASLPIEKIFHTSPLFIITLLIVTPLLTTAASGIPIIKTFKKSPRSLFAK